MRDRTGYICNWKKPFQGILDTTILCCLVIMVTFVRPFIIWGSFACPVAYIIDQLFGLRYLRDGVNPCSSSTRNYRDLHRRTIHCTLHLVRHIFLLARLIHLSSIQSLFVRLSQYLFGAFLALTFIPFTMHDFFHAPLWIKVLFVPAGVIVWLVLPLLRNKTAYVVIIFSYSYVTYLKVYTGQQLEIFSHRLLNRMLLVSGLALWIVPIVAAIDERLVHIYNRLVKVCYCDQSKTVYFKRPICKTGNAHKTVVLFTLTETFKHTL